MDDYISRKSAIKRLKELHFGCKDFHLCGGVLLELNAIDALPAADVVEVRHGRWKYDDFDGDGLDYQCTICKRYSRRDYNYCPSCGAKMDGGKDE